jgi:hypothetical protein
MKNRLNNLTKKTGHLAYHDGLYKHKTQGEPQTAIGKENVTILLSTPRVVHNQNGTSSVIPTLTDMAPNKCPWTN